MNINPGFPSIIVPYTIQLRHSNPAPVDRMSASAWLHKHPWMTCWKNRPSTSMTHITCESKLCSVMMSSMHPYSGKLCGDRACSNILRLDCPAFSAGIKCLHCIIDIEEWGQRVNPCAADGQFGQYKMMQKPRKWQKPCHMGTHLRVLIKSYPMNTKMIGFRWFSKIFASLCFLTKVASVLEGLRWEVRLQKEKEQKGESFLT